MDPKELFYHLRSQGYNFFTGVPDSALKNFQDALEESYVPNIIATHESQAVAIAVGALLAGKKSCVYMQNSGLGNTINPLTSLCLPYDLCPHLVIGHRHTLPQHKIMGEIDEDLLSLVGYTNYTLVRGSNNVK